jgi:hypothetical protein
MSRPARRLRRRYNSVFARLVGLTLTALLWVQVGIAQVTTARLEGLIRDTSGAAIPGVAVTATQTGTNLVFEGITNEIGLYIFPRLTPGTYTVTGELPGFKRASVSGIRLEVGDTATRHITLEVGDVSETITVEGDVAAVDTVSTAIGDVINTRQIEQLPLVSRNPMDLFYLQAGANRFAGGGRIDGLRGTTNNVTVEGIAATEPDLGSGATSTAAPVPIEAVSEYRVVTSSAAAESGRGAGSQVQVVYRSGTNDFHGSLFEFHRNKVLNANTFTNNRSSIPRPDFIRNQYGGSFGGPIRKDKAFFHFTYEGIRQKTTSTNNYMVYTPTLKSGIFRYYSKGANSVSLVDRTTGALLVPESDIGTINLLTVDSTRVGKDPSGTFDRLLGSLPAPNNYEIGDGFNTAGYNLLSNNINKEYQLVFKGDYILTPGERMAVSYAYRKTNSNGSLMPNGQRSGYDQEARYPAVIISLNSTLSPTLLNEFRIGGTQRNNNSLNGDQNRFNPQGIVNFTGLGTPGRNHPANTALQDSFTPVIYTLNDNITWIRGVHSFRAGADLRLSRDQLHYGDDYWIPVISTTNSNNPANVPALTALAAADRTRAQQLTNDITGTVGVIRQSFHANAADRFTPFNVKYLQLRAHEYGFFFQDTWKLRPNLTLNLGTRYELMPPQFEAGGLFANPIGGVQGVYGISSGSETKLGLAPDKGRETYKTDWNNWAPSVGFNWDPTKDGKWSIGANYRVTYDRHYLTNTLFQIVSQEGTSTDRQINGVPGMRLDALPGLFNSTTGYTDPGAPFGPKEFNRTGLVTAYDPSYYTPYTQNWSLRVQREVMKDTVVTVSYVGNKATGLMRGIDINEIEVRDNGFLNGFLAAQRNLGTSGDPVSGEPTGVFGQIYGVMSTADQNSIRPDISTGSAATVADFIDRTRATSNYLQRAGLPLTFFRMNPQFQTAWVQGNNSYSTFNGLKVEVSRKFQDGLQFDVNYTFSKTLTDFEGSQNNRQAYRDNDNRVLDKSYAGIDAPHVWNANFNWELPVGTGQRWMSSAGSVVNGFLGGWQMNGIFAYSAGTPFTINSGRNKLNMGVTSTVDCNGCDPKITSKVIKGDVIRLLTDDEIKLFKDPPAGSPGSTALRYFRSPSNWVLDGSVFKSFRLNAFMGEQSELQTRFEFFNAFNHVYFGAPSNANSSITSGSFAVVTPPNSYQPRIVQVALKLLF